MSPAGKRFFKTLKLIYSAPRFEGLLGVIDAAESEIENDPAAAHHHYVFKFAKADVMNSMEAHLLGRLETVAFYEKELRK